MSESEAKQRLDREGPNQIFEQAATPAWMQMLGQLTDVTVLALLAAALLAVGLGLGERGSGSILHRFGDAIAIGIIVLLNALTGFVQERKAERALRALRALGAPMAAVVREGKPESIPAAELVRGDLIELHEGDRVPADARLVGTTDLVVNEAALTGESMPVDKREDGELPADTPLGDRTNMVFLGTHVVRGHARALVAATGMSTELGRIAELLRGVETPATPLQLGLRRFGLWVVAGSAGLALVVFAVGLVQLEASLSFLVLTAVSLAVAAIPEGLPAITTIVLALGVQRMARRNALVRRLAAVETLGSADVICTDKTGTLTQNRMLIRRIMAGGRTWEESGLSLLDDQGQKAAPDFARRDALAELILACGAAPAARLPADEGSPEGDPTDAALLRLYTSFESSLGAAGADSQTLRVLPFDRDRRMATTVLRDAAGVSSRTHGAPEAVLARSSFMLDDQGRETPLDTVRRAELTALVESWAELGLRVLGLARSPARATLDAERTTTVERGALMDLAERDLTLIGLVGLADPPRPEVKDAIGVARRAGIRTIMITGDHPKTGAAIAREIQLVGPEEAVITGTEMDALGPDELASRVDRVGVVARATAANKLRLVEALRARGHVVAMTGDGVNDAPAIKAASIGVAMGRTGTDVTREAADMVLLDDNYATIVSAVEEGRIVYSNIKRFIVFLFAVNTGLVLTVLVAALFGWPPVLTPTQILWINLITNGLPALALGMEPVHLDPMKQAPRPSGESLVSRAELSWLMGYGVWMALLGLATFGFTFQPDPQSLVQARTATFSVLALAPLFHALNCRSRRDSVLTLGLFSNWRLLGAFGLALGLQAVAVYFPGLESMFGTAPLSAHAVLAVFALSASVWVVGELHKALERAIAAAH